MIASKQNSFIQSGSIRLGGANPTRVNFKGSNIPASLTGTHKEPFAVTNGLTLISTIQGSAQTFTFAGAAGYETGGGSPSTDITGLVSPQFNIAVDGGAPANVTLAVEGMTTGALIAAEMQTKIRALGGAAATVTVAFTDGVYVITSGTAKSTSAIAVTAGTAHDIAPALKLGDANGAVAVAGTGTAGYETGASGGITDITALTTPKFKIAADGDGTAHSVTLTVTDNDTGLKIAAEMQTKIQALGGAYAGVTVSFADDVYIITSGTDGILSKIRITAGATNDCSADLKIGDANGAVDTDGTGTAGTETGAEGAATNLFEELEPFFNISVDGSYLTSINISTDGMDTGNKIAAELQKEIRAAGFTGVTVAFSGGVYVITSATTGTGSIIRVESGTSAIDIAALLKIGEDNGATDTDGTGDFVNGSAVTADEVAALINATITGAVASNVNGYVKLTCKYLTSIGAGSSISMGNGSINTVLGFTNAQSNIGVGSLNGDLMLDSDYVAIAVLSGSTTTASRNLSITNKTPTGFNIYCETATATDIVDLLVFGNS